MKKYYIYSLSKKGSIFYIGCTMNLSSRLNNHRKKFGSLIEMDTIDEYFGSSDAAFALESFWIKKYLDLGINLLNVSNCLPNSQKKTVFTYACRPSIRDAATERAKKEGVTLSSIIEMALIGYVAAEVWKDMEGNPVTPNSIILDPRPLNA